MSVLLIFSCKNRTEPKIITPNIGQYLHFAFLTSKSWVRIKGNKISIYLLGGGKKQREKGKKKA
jgi:hypothetical protein